MKICYKFAMDEQKVEQVVEYSNLSFTLLKVGCDKSSVCKTVSYNANLTKLNVK